MGLTLLNEGIENNPFKQRVRLDLLEQITCLNRTPANQYRNLVILTMPGEQCILENGLDDHFSDTKYHTLLSLHCVENDLRKIDTIRKNLPSKATLHVGNLDDVICKSIRNGTNEEYDVMWLDFCCAANPVLIEQVSKYASLCLKKTGLIYVTFWIKGIKCATGGKQALADLVTAGTVLPDPNCPQPRNMSNVTLKNIIVAELQKAFKRKKVSVKKVYDVIYGGGPCQHTPMVTLGFSKNILKKDFNYVRPIQEDMMRISKIRKRIAQKKSIRDSKRATVFALFDKEVPDRAIKEHCEITTSQLAAYKAHYRKQGVAWRVKDREVKVLEPEKS